MRHIKWIGCVLVLFACQSAAGQFPSAIKRQIDKVDNAVGKYKDIEMTDEEEIRLGEDISSRIRNKYGVVQDPAVHRYVTMVGTVVAKKSSRSSLPFHFIVLDTDGVNAFAAPGGFIHITRGALSLIKNEAELGGVLAHEIAHVTERHTLRAIQKGKVVQMASSEKSVTSNPELFKRLADECYKIVFAGFGREDELDADEHGLRFSADCGYDPTGLGLFLKSLKERNSDSQIKQGLFASHPEMDERLQKLDNIVKNNKWTGGVVLPDRFVKNVKYTPVELANIVVAGEGAAGLAGGGKEDENKQEGEKKEGQEKKEKKSRFSLGRLTNPLGTGEKTTQSAAVTGSGGSRGVDKERLAKGGPNSSLVAVSVTDKDLEEFKKEGKLKA